MSIESLVKQKVASANVWIGFYNQYKDKSSVGNACMALGRLSGVLEEAIQLDVPEKAEYEKMIERVFHAFNQIMAEENVATL